MPFLFVLIHTDIIFPSAFIDPSIGIVIDAPSMALAIGKIAYILGTILGIVPLTFSVELVILEIAGIIATIGSSYSALTLAFTIDPITAILYTVCPGVSTFAVYFSIRKATGISISRS